MSIVQKVSDLATRIGTEFKTVRATIGNLSSLPTADKSNLVAAITELSVSAGAQINDSAAGTGTVYSSSKTETLLSAKQASDADLTAIAGLAGNSGLLKKTAANTWSLDTSSYALSSALAGYIPTSEKAAANGVATLGADSKIPSAQLPALAISNVFTVASQSAMLALSAQEGDIAIRTDISKTFILSTNSPATLADWKEMLAPTGGVTSVDGRTGVVTLTDLYASSASVGDEASANFVNVFEAALL